MWAEVGLPRRGRRLLTALAGMLKKSASGVLALLPGTVKRDPRVSCGAAGLLGTRCVSARQGWAGEKSGLFEHPARFLEAGSW
jgi:hypothetical protein